MSDNALRIIWHGHSCFRLEYQGYSIVLDPYADGMVDGLPPLRLRANEVLCSHEHDDHNCRAAVTLLPAAEKNPFTVTKIESFHDNVRGTKRGRNTIHLFSVGGMRVAHFGDIGCMPTEAQCEMLSGLDAAMLPIGGYYTIGAENAKELVDRLRPKVVIPMHYRSAQFGFPVLGTLEEYTQLVDNVISYPDNTFCLTPDARPQTAVLRL